MQKTYSYKYKDKIYPVILTKKRISRIWYRYKDGAIYISMPYFISAERALKELDNLASRLIKERKEISPIGEDYVYLLGEKYENHFNDFYKEIKKEATKIFLERLTYYEKLMHIEVPYKLRTQKMSSRYGSNSAKTHTINLSLILIHYSIEIIDSVVIHELCHDKIKNHQSQFYKLLLLFCPNYYELRKKLRKGEFK